MPRYFFNVNDGANSPDQEGTELPNDAAARREALTFAGKMLADDASRFVPGDGLQIEVTDTMRMAIYQLDFRLSASPSVRSGSAVSKAE